jgi:hypothetical protein
MADDEKAQGDEQRRKAAELLREHDRMAAAQAAGQETKAPYQSGTELDGNYTVQDARDKAAHVPGWHEQAKAGFSEQELSQFKEQKRDLQEISDAKASERSDVWSEHSKEQNEREKSMKGASGMTPEQQEKVNQSMKNTNMQRESMAGGASDVNSKPTPNDPTSIDKARDIGKDLNKSGVEMDK